MTDTTTPITTRPLAVPQHVRSAIDDLLGYIWDELYQDFYARPESEHHHISACIVKGWLAELNEEDQAAVALPRATE